MYSQTYSILVRRNIEMSIRIGILGYGNLGRGVEMAVNAAEDLELVGVFSRRDPSKVKIASEGVKVYSADALANMQKDIDVLIICGGSATDLPKMTPVYAKDYNVVDSFDTHARIPEHFKNVDEAAKAAGKTAVISVGWDPGMFSVNRLYSHAILPNGKAYTFWGRGVSQGHSDAIRRIKGVKDARQYTVPVESALEAVRSGSNPELTTRQKHTRECYVVAEEGADLARIEKEIKTMPNYFDEYDTTVNFISEEELLKNHAGLPHGGSVIVSGSTNEGKTKHVIEYKLKLDSNPEFTGSVLAAYARAVAKLNKEGNIGCKTAFDIAPAYLCPEEGDFLRAHFL
jgi:diaminopimelate dehydrogenase